MAAATDRGSSTPRHEAVKRQEGPLARRLEARASVVTGPALWYNANGLAGKAATAAAATTEGGRHWLSQRVSQRGFWGASWTA
jgi:hypothetical protein